MKQRVNNPKHKSYHIYGGRGIKVCDRWMQSFTNFYNDTIEDYIPGLDIDRINNDGNYEPGNVRWVIRKVNIRNSRVAKLTEWDVREIRANKGLISQNKLASMYSVSRRCIRSVLSNRTWK